MARGDVSTVINSNVVNDGTATVQPSSGIEIILTDASIDLDSTNWAGLDSDKVPAMHVARFDGTDEAVIESGEFTHNGATIWFRDSKHVFDNTNYLRYKNLIGLTRNLSISYVEVG